MYIEALRLKAGETVRDGLELGADRVKMIESFLQAEVAQVMGAEFIAQKARELLVLFEEGMFPVGAEHMMAVLDALQHAVQLPTQPLVEPESEYLGDLAGSQPQQAEVAGALEQFILETAVSP